MSGSAKGSALNGQRHASVLNGHSIVRQRAPLPRYGRRATLAVQSKQRASRAQARLRAAQTQKTMRSGNWNSVPCPGVLGWGGSAIAEEASLLRGPWGDHNRARRVGQLDAEAVEIGTHQARHLCEDEVASCRPFPATRPSWGRIKSRMQKNCSSGDKQQKNVSHRLGAVL